MSLCKCPHGCKRECDSQARCPFCWNDGKGCPVLFHGKTDEAERTPPQDWAHSAAEKIHALFNNASYFSTRNAEHRKQMLEGWAEIIRAVRAVAVPEPAAQQESEIVKVAEELSEAIWLKMNCYCSNCPEATMKAAKKLKELLKQWKSSVTSSVEQSLSLELCEHNYGVNDYCEKCAAAEPAPTPSRAEIELIPTIWETFRVVKGEIYVFEDEAAAKQKYDELAEASSLRAKED